LKNRDYSNPLSIIVSKKNIDKYAYVSNKIQSFINLNWPDFIGFILPKKSMIKNFVTSDFDTVGLVCSSQYNVELSENIEYPLASTSANISGEKEIIDFDIAFKTFEKKVDAIIYGENNGNLNTLVNIKNKEFNVLREGKYSNKEILKLLDYKE